MLTISYPILADKRVDREGHAKTDSYLFKFFHFPLRISMGMMEPGPGLVIEPRQI